MSYDFSSNWKWKINTGAGVFFLVTDMFFQSSACYCTPFYRQALFVQLNYSQFIPYDSDIHLISGQRRLLFRNQRGFTDICSAKVNSAKVEFTQDRFLIYFFNLFSRTRALWLLRASGVASEVPRVWRQHFTGLTSNEAPANEKALTQTLGAPDRSSLPKGRPHRAT